MTTDTDVYGFNSVQSLYTVLIFYKGTFYRKDKPAEFVSSIYTYETCNQKKP